MKNSIVRPDEFKREVYDFYNNLLNTPLMQINPLALNDDQLLNSILDYSSALAKGFPRFCTWVTIEGVGKDNYQNRDYKFVKLGFNGQDIFTINFSQFMYPMSPNHGEIKFSRYNSSEAKYVCTVDNKSINPEDYFERKIGHRLFYIYSFSTITKFEQQKECYFFADKQTSPSDIRKHILTTQYNILSHLQSDPVVNVPGAVVKIETPTGAISYLHSVTSCDSQETAIEVFNTDFRVLVENLMEEKKKQLLSIGYQPT